MSNTNHDDDENQQQQQHNNDNQQQKKTREELELISKNLNKAIERVLASPQSSVLATCRVRVAPSPSGYRLGLMANERINADGELALGIPHDDMFIFTPQLAQRVVFENVLPENYDGWTGDVGLLAMLLLNELARSSSNTHSDSFDSNNSSKKNLGTDLPRRPEVVQNLISTWVQSLPTIDEMRAGNMHPLLWNEEDQEVLQSSSTRKLYRMLDDADEDATWLMERVWKHDPHSFPPHVTLPNKGADGQTQSQTQTHPCFTTEGFKWALSLVFSRSFYVDGSLRLIPIMDFANHDDLGMGGNVHLNNNKNNNSNNSNQVNNSNPVNMSTVGTEEVTGGNMGRFNTVRGSVLRTGKGRRNGKNFYEPKREVFLTHGPRSCAEYLLEYGFLPQRHLPRSKNDYASAASTISPAVSELTFELRPDDRFLDDKLDILEFETYRYDSSSSSSSVTPTPMEPTQTFDVVSDFFGTGRGDGEPDPAMMQFLRLCELGASDAFLLEAVFRKEVWDFMSLPVSESNERSVLNTIANACEKALKDMDMVDNNTNRNHNHPENDETDDNDHGDDAPSPAQLCSIVRGSERKALSRTLDFVNRELEALDLKEYYQERRLKDLGLDSEWGDDAGASSRPPGIDGEYDDDEDYRFGATRVPGSLDW